MSAVEVGGLRVDPAGYVATLDGRELALTLKEFDLLVVLARHAGAFVPRRRLMAEVWGEADRRTRTLDIHIQRLRAKLGGRPSAIETRVRVGYRLVPWRLAPHSPAAVTET